MGAQVCKGRGVDDDETAELQMNEIDIDSIFPVQSRMLSMLDWTDELVVDYRCKENCRHNHALGKLIRNGPPNHERQKISLRKQPLKFADNVEHILIEIDDDAAP